MITVPNVLNNAVIYERMESMSGIRISVKPVFLSVQVDLLVA